MMRDYLTQNMVFVSECKRILISFNVTIIIYQDLIKPIEKVRTVLEKITDYYFIIQK